MILVISKKDLINENQAKKHRKEQSFSSVSIEIESNYTQLSHKIIRQLNLNERIQPNTSLKCNKNRQPSEKKSNLESNNYKMK